MAPVANGDTITINYSVRLAEDGTIIDSNDGHDPFEFTVGEQLLIPVIEEMVLGMEPGEKKSTDVSSDETFGPYVDELVMTLKRSYFPENYIPLEGHQLKLPQEGGQPILVTVKAFTDDEITLDANHPLAGKALSIEVEVVEINPEKIPEKTPAEPETTDSE